ncbi:LptF/LptG family permease [Pleomorphochaeta sp. DL1XJH-081]|jgi:lipopolysaccharide export system permease protein|uniref:LptF/LptG family permease n=1 Tax=Pleomorphochaeta sp. DL1XJH-081 TaxID=3409690 RepID=UPI003BB7505C
MERRNVSTFTILRTYVLREFLLSLAVAFLFFFFIFFINQLLLFAQRILLKNVDVLHVLKLVGLSVPQILLYTIPFSTLSAAAMAIGDLSARGELLALRSSGISLRRMFEPIAIVALVLSIGTFFVADALLPYSHQQFRTLYAELLRDLPTIEIESYAVNRIGDIVLVTGEVDDDNIGSLLLFDTANRSNNQVISATGGTVTLVDLESFLYRLDLENPRILSTEGDSLERFTLADAQRMTYYLDFSDQISRFTDITPSQLSTRDLRKAISIREEDLAEDTAIRERSLMKLEQELSDVIRNSTIEEGSFSPESVAKILELEEQIERLKEEKSINFYLQYYRAELHKKIALSVSCFVLVFITFPLALLRLKHGRLFGFGLSLIVASSYWFLLFFAQTKILDVDFNPGFLIWAPNMVVAVISTMLLLRSRRV